MKATDALANNNNNSSKSESKSSSARNRKRQFKEISQPHQQQDIKHNPKAEAAAVIDVLVDAFVNDEGDDEDDVGEEKDGDGEEDFDDDEDDDDNALRLFVNDGDGDGDDNGTAAAEQIVEFTMVDMNASFYHEVRDILSATDWDQQRLHVGLLADTITKQMEVGGVLTASETAVIGFISVVSVAYHQQHEHLSVAHIVRYLVDRCRRRRGARRAEEVRRMLTRGNVGLVFHERPVNTPLAVVPHMFDSLWEDLRWVTDDRNAERVGAHLTGEQIQSFAFEGFVVVVRYRWVRERREEGKGKRKREVSDLRVDGITSKQNMRLVFEHAEDELFVECSYFSFAFERNRRVWRVCFVRRKEFYDAIQKMKKVFV